MSLSIEIGNVFSATFKRGRLLSKEAQRAIAQYRRIPVQFVEIDMDASLGLADAFGIFASDA